MGQLAVQLADSEEAHLLEDHHLEDHHLEACMADHAEDHLGGLLGGRGVNHGQIHLTNYCHVCLGDLQVHLPELPVGFSLAQLGNCVI